MKFKFILLILCMVAIVTIFPVIANAEDNDIINFPDNNLKQALLSANADTSGDGEITESEMAALTGELDLSNKEISDITGLQYAVNITGLKLDMNDDLEDIDTLSTLNNLTILSLASTGIHDISVVVNYPELTYLDITECDIDDISTLSQISNLETLLLDYTEVSFLTPIERMISLKKISLRGTKVKNISTLSHLTNLTYLNISSNYLSANSISFLEPLSNLEYLNIAYNNFIDSTPLGGMHHLKELDASHCYFSSLAFLSNMNDLETLNIKCCNIADVSVLADKTKLTKIDVSQNYLNPNDTDGDMAVLAGIDTVVGAADQNKISITYKGGFYGTPEKKTDSIYHGGTVALPGLTFECSFTVDGWDTNGNGIQITEWTGEPQIMEPKNCSRLEFHSINKLPSPLFISSIELIHKFIIGRIY